MARNCAELIMVLVLVALTSICAMEVHTIRNSEDGPSEYVDNEVKFLAKAFASSDYNESVKELANDFLRAAGIPDRLPVYESNISTERNKCSCSLRGLVVANLAVYHALYRMLHVTLLEPRV